MTSTPGQNPGCTARMEQGLAPPLAALRTKGTGMRRRRFGAQAVPTVAAGSPLHAGPGSSPLALADRVPPVHTVRKEVPDNAA